MHPRTRPLVPILLLLLLASATPSPAGPITGGAQPVQGVRVAPPAETGQGARRVAAVQPGPGTIPSGSKAIRLTPEEQALLAIRENAQARVTDLALRAASTTDPGARLELQRQAVEIKQQAQIRFLETKIAFALDRGDLAAVHELEMGLERLLHPPARTVPAEPASPVKGGAR